MLQMQNEWDDLLRTEMEKPYFQRLLTFLHEEYETHTIYPAKEHLLQAMRLTPYNDVKVVILGQDPYHNPGQAHGLSFSVPDGITLPPSLRNMFDELRTDLNVSHARSGDLSDWARQGVLLLNAVLTVRENEPLSHRERGWETFTDAIIRLLNERERPVVFVLWGRAAREKAKYINRMRHPVLESAHPSPLSAYRGFFGSRPYTQVNERLQDMGVETIRWV